MTLCPQFLYPSPGLVVISQYRLPDKLEFANPLTNGLLFHNKLYNINTSGLGEETKANRI